MSAEKLLFITAKDLRSVKMLEKKNIFSIEWHRRQWQKYTALGNLRGDNGLALVTLDCEDGQQVAVNYFAKCQIAEISHQFVFDVRLQRYQINLNSQSRFGHQCVSCPICSNWLIFGLMSVRSDLKICFMQSAAKHGIFYKDVQKSAHTRV